MTIRSPVIMSVCPNPECIRDSYGSRILEILRMDSRPLSVRERLFENFQQNSPDLEHLTPDSKELIFIGYVQHLATMHNKVIDAEGMKLVRTGDNNCSRCGSKKIVIQYPECGNCGTVLLIFGEDCEGCGLPRNEALHHRRILPMALPKIIRSLLSSLASMIRPY